ncbi:MAG: GNAT family N-acetyltransferase [Actinomycetota bacterium]
MTTEIRACRPDEFERWLKVCWSTFGIELRADDPERTARYLELDRTVGAFVDDELVGTTAAFSFTLTVPGGYVPAAGITMVTVLPSHRRRGLLTAMMHRQLEDVHDRREPLAVLWASEGDIYERFGYGMATLNAPIDIERDRARFRSDQPPTGTIRILEKDTALKTLPEIYERVCAQIPGMYARTPDWWEAHRLYDPEHDRDGGGPMNCAVLDIDGRAEAYALYRLHNEWRDTSPTGFLEVLEALGATPIATREIWRFLFGIDLMTRVKAYHQPVMHPLHFMLAEPRRLRSQVSDGLWVRVIDVKEALESRSYALEGSLVLDIQDPLLPTNHGLWRLTVEGRTTSVERTDDAADLSVPVARLGSVYLGGFTFTQWAGAGDVRELRPGAAAAADLLFHTTTTPWCPEVF